MNKCTVVVTPKGVVRESNLYRGGVAPIMEVELRTKREIIVDDIGDIWVTDSRRSHGKVYWDIAQQQFFTEKTRQRIAHRVLKRL